MTTEIIIQELKNKIKDLPGDGSPYEKLLKVSSEWILEQHNNSLVLNNHGEFDLDEDEADKVFYEATKRLGW